MHKPHSHTTRQMYLSCPRRYYLKKMLRYERDTDPAALRMGRAYAEALEQHSIGAAHRYLEDTYGKHIAQAQVAEQQHVVDRLTLELAQLKVLSAAYIDRFGHTLAAEAKALGHRIISSHREVEFDDPILGTGRLDAVVQIGHVRTVGLEDKLLTPGFWRDVNEHQLRINAQVTAYFAAMRAAGTPLDELRYRVTFKPTIKPNSTKRESLEDYIERLTDRVRNEEGYSFREYQLYRSDAEMDAFIRRTQTVNRMIHRSTLDLKRHGEAAFPANFGNACLEFGGCEMLDLCVYGPSAPGYRIAPKRAKLSAIQQEALSALDSALYPELRVADVAKCMGSPDTATRTALNRLCDLGLATKERRGRAAIYVITDAGKERLP